MKSINHSSGNKGVLFLALILIIVVTVSAFIAFSLREKQPAP